MELVTVYETPKHPDSGNHYRLHCFAIDECGNLYAATRAMIFKASLDGSSTCIFGRKGISYISSIADDADGSILYNCSSGHVKRLTQSTTGKWVASTVTQVGGKRVSATSLCVSQGGDLVFIKGWGFIQSMNRGGQLIKIGDIPRNYGGNVCAYKGVVLVWEYPNHRVLKIDNNVVTSFDACAEEVAYWMGETFLVDRGGVCSVDPFTIFAKTGETLGTENLVKGLQNAVHYGGALYVANDTTIQRIRITRWTPEIHPRLPGRLRKCIKVILLARSRRGCVLARLPWDILCLLYGFMCT